MQKLRLEDLAVESFATSASVNGPIAGTVRGNQQAARSAAYFGGVQTPCTEYGSCWVSNCGPEASCAAATCSPNETCDNTCRETCLVTDCGGGGNLCAQSGSCIEDTEGGWDGYGPY